MVRQIVPLRYSPDRTPPSSDSFERPTQWAPVTESFVEETVSSGEVGTPPVLVATGMKRRQGSSADLNEVNLIKMFYHYYFYYRFLLRRRNFPHHHHEGGHEDGTRLKRQRTSFFAFTKTLTAKVRGLILCGTNTLATLSYLLNAPVSSFLLIDHPYF